jgi:GNAT superfamily N-acetyltransferase
MIIEIKKLTPELINEYTNFFEKEAFTDNPEWEGCYCVYYHWNESFESERTKYEAEGGTCFKRELAKRLIHDGTLKGYLALVDGIVAGWCNVNDKNKFYNLSKVKRPELWDETVENKKVKTIVCFTIAPNMRKKDIATELLKKVCEDAKNNGYDFVEAYPGTGETSERSYHGPYTLYEKSGFSVYKHIDGEAIMRYYLD